MPDEWRKKFEAGAKLLEEGDDEAAVMYLTESTTLDGGNACVYCSRAVAYERLNMLRESLTDAQRCISLQPDQYVNYFRTARIFHTLSEHDRCIQMIEEARRRLNPSDASYPRQIEELGQLETAACQQRRKGTDRLTVLPFELLFDICNIVIDDSDVLAGPRRASHFVVTLGSVCRSLRELVHQTPRFWQSLALSDRFLRLKCGFWLERLAGRPLCSLALFNIGFTLSDTLQKILRATCPESWKHLRVEGRKVGAYALCTALESYDLKLHSLSIVSPKTASPLDSGMYIPGNFMKFIEPVSSEEPARRLLLHVGGITLSFGPVSHITHLELCSNQLTTSQEEPLLYILHNMPHLRSLIFRPQYADRSFRFWHEDFVPGPAPDPQATSVLRLTALEILRLEGVPLGESSITLQLPRLEVLDLQNYTISTGTLLRRLINSSPADKPPIRQIRLNKMVIHPDILEMVLSAFSNTLESLETSQCSDLGREFYELLSCPYPNDNGSLLCPRLQDINFSGMNKLGADPLVRMIKAPSAPPDSGKPAAPTPIRNVVVDGCRNIDAEVLP